MIKELSELENDMSEKVSNRLEGLTTSNNYLDLFDYEFIKKIINHKYSPEEQISDQGNYIQFGKFDVIRLMDKIEVRIKQLRDKK